MLPVLHLDIIVIITFRSLTIPTNLKIPIFKIFFNSEHFSEKVLEYSKKK